MYLVLMDSMIFTDRRTGALVSTPHQVEAFVPAPLPPNLDLGSLVMPLSQATLAVGELNGASRRLANPSMLVRPLQRREALTSSAMEGTFTTEDDLLLADAGLEDAPDQGSIEVRNYLRALTTALDLLQTGGLPICHRVICEAHRILLSGVGSQRGAHRAPGQYRQEQNAIGGVGRGIENARFVPPPADHASRCMDELEAYINRADRGAMPPLIDIALVHYQLETIHPFLDGNGRVGRMLISLMAVERGMFDAPLLYVSPELEHRKDEYINLMLAVSTNGKWEAWIGFFLDVIERSARSSIAVVDRLIQLQADYRQRAAAVSRTANAVTLVDRLFEVPIVTVRDVQDMFDITYRPARNTIDKLVEQDILKEVSGHYPAVFVAPGIMRVAARTP